MSHHLRNIGLSAFGALMLAMSTPAQSFAHGCDSDMCKTCVRWNSSGQCSYCVPKARCHPLPPFSVRKPSAIFKNPGPIFKDVLTTRLPRR